MTPIFIEIVGTPRPQPRPRLSQNGHVYNPSKLIGPWKKLIKTEARKHLPAERLDQPLCVDIVFRFPRPKKHFLRGKLRDGAPAWHTQVPDKDNLEKAVMDALTDVGFWRDDASVCDGRTSKIFVTEHGQPGCSITIRDPDTL